ncbi:M1 family metallopeptidase [Puia dinghuensis]|uniref:Aminopeptidase N n=1 Tax=Puia dinghuensis TaxID=1792502 RepID=A0A8J2UHK2_9BACT|nr:M1 family metallopeptidase [Puia dinghuensis]GGB17184.1 peptidase [Puia dinghuensis]
MRRHFIRLTLVFLLVLPCWLYAQPYNPAIDVQHYEFSLTLSDSTNNIHGEAAITLTFRENIPEFALDLTRRNSEGKGMTVTTIKEGNTPIRFTQQSEQLIIHTPGAPGGQHTYKIKYEGIPADGLIISLNKFGSRGFFGDNWPNRAHNWLPCVDHPSDKATVSFNITAPDHYTVVANGELAGEQPLPGHRKLTRWKESQPLSPKVMVIGVADFAVDHPGDAMGVPVWNYVYKENKDRGFHSYAYALEILPFYISHIGPYPFEKCGNVQSKTRFGGLENASAIFYYEGSVGASDIESLMAHEIAHQWFGDAATETQWKHLWLSEGFATYMTLCYLENKYGADTLKSSLRLDRQKVIDFEDQRLTPIVDTTVKSDYMQLLNPNNYEKGGWVLHMLRRTIGDSAFWKGISTYYATYRNTNASSADFEQVMESVSGRDLHGFFHQWLETPGHPRLTIAWKYDAGKKAVIIDVTQQGGYLFTFPLEYSLDGVLQHIDIHDKTTHVEIPFPEKPASLIPDPNTNLLATFEVIHS